MQSLDNHERDKFFRMLIRAVVIRATSNDNILAESSMSGQYQVVSSRLARRVRTVWIEWGFLGELAFWTERSVDLISRHLQKSRHPIFPGSLQQHASANDVGPHKRAGIGNASINVALCRKIQNPVKSFGLEQSFERFGIRDIALHKSISTFE